VKNYFENKFVEQTWFKIRFDGVQFNSLSREDIDVLCKDITEEEIVDAVRQCGSTKSPGPDGYNFYFLKNNWEVVGPNIINAILNFQESGYIPRGCNTSFITLVPKQESPFSLNDYRPISLVGCMYKILSKILANRLKCVLPKVIDLHQFAFLSGRGMLDSILIANEIADFIRKERKKGVIVKVDYEKTYDLVNWQFLYYMMKRLGFDGKWIKWIKMCLESTAILILVNESPTEEFKPRKGL